MTGGMGRNGVHLTSTEIYDGSSWTYAASLPSKRSSFSASTLDNSVFVFGEFFIILTYNKYCLTVSIGGWTGKRRIDDVLRYNGTTDKWLNVGKMRAPRSFYSLALLTDVSKICP